MLKKVLPVCSFLIAAGVCYGQATIEMPSMPDMPAVTAPVMDGTFYKPAVPYTGGKAVKKQENNTNTDSTAKNETVISDGTTTQDLLSSFLGGSNLLSASDISSLYDSGAFNTISSLTSTNAAATNAQTNVMLQQILSSLEELKTQQKNATPAQREVLNNTQHDNQTFRQREASILRFKINGYSITDSLTEVFFSEAEADGSFLLTADRKYFLNQKPKTETFYLLFKTVKNNGSSTVYSVIPRIAQDSENKNSFVYKLCQLKDLTAEKTGNLVVLHYNNGLTADMLLDIDQ